MNATPTRSALVKAGVIAAAAVPVAGMFASSPTPRNRPPSALVISPSVESTMAKRQKDQRFMKLLAAYGGSGGLARAGDVVSSLQQHSGRGVGVLARWMVDRAVISLEWQSDTWFPLFQFNVFDMAPRPEMASVCAELSGLFDAWELAEWFARPNSTLHDHRPADRLHADLPAVLDAARVDRFVALG